MFSWLVLLGIVERITSTWFVVTLVQDQRDCLTAKTWNSYCLFTNFQWLSITFWIQVDFLVVCQALLGLAPACFTDVPLAFLKLSLGWTASSWNFNSFLWLLWDILPALSLIPYSSLPFYLVNLSRLYCLFHPQPSAHGSASLPATQWIMCPFMGSHRTPLSLLPRPIT